MENGGIWKIKEEKVMKKEEVREVMYMMKRCGMYDY